MTGERGYPEQDTIDLQDFLKMRGMVETGGEAKFRVQGGEVRLNGEIETRRRKKLRRGTSWSTPGSACGWISNVTASAYEAAVLDFRRRKDEHFAAGRGPVNPAAFAGLSYYPPDEAWAFTVLLEPLPQDDAGAEWTLETNTGETRTMARVGQVQLPLPDGERTLLVFAPLGEERPERVFIPFRDATSGDTTYGAGRYLDAPWTGNWAGTARWCGSISIWRTTRTARTEKAGPARSRPARTGYRTR